MRHLWKTNQRHRSSLTPSRKCYQVAGPQVRLTPKPEWSTARIQNQALYIASWSLHLIFNKWTQDPNIQLILAAKWTNRLRNLWIFQSTEAAQRCATVANESIARLYPTFRNYSLLFLSFGFWLRLTVANGSIVRRTDNWPRNQHSDNRRNQLHELNYITLH